MERAPGAGGEAYRWNEHNCIFNRKFDFAFLLETKGRA